MFFHNGSKTASKIVVNRVKRIVRCGLVPARLEDSYVIVSDSPGTSTAIKSEVLEQYAISGVYHVTHGTIHSFTCQRTTPMW
jgi:hypothetical protein